MHRNDVLGIIKRRAKQAGLPQTTCCQTFSATGITTYLENGGTIEDTKAIAAQESSRITSFMTNQKKRLGSMQWREVLFRDKHFKTIVLSLSAFLCRRKNPVHW
jgi:hypothetical protein